MRPLFVFDLGPEARPEDLKPLKVPLPEGALLYLSGFALKALPEDLAEHLAEQAANGRIELLGGGLYSPYLPLLPERDAAWQLSDMAELIEERLGVEVEGAYLPDGAFDLRLVPVLAEEGYTYALLPKAALKAPAHVEVEDRGIRLFPFAEGQVDDRPPDPNAPYPAAFIEGADHPRMLPRQSARAKDLYAKMRWVSDKLEEAHRAPEPAYQRLYRGQWGPAYRGQDPAAAWAHRQLIAAENLSDPRKYAWVEASVEDIDGDGYPEAVLESHVMAAFLRPAEGGRLFALDLRDPELPVLAARSLGLSYHARDPERLQPVFERTWFEASRYRERVHLLARGRLGATPVEVKKTYKLRAKARRLELELRLQNQGQQPLSGHLALDVGPRPEPRLIEDGARVGPLTIQAPGARVVARDGGLFFVYALELAPERARRFRLVFEEDA